jgi:hypothetical protein
MEALDLQEVIVLHAGDRTFPLGRNVKAVAASRLLEDV